jgi:hypothetical protein
MVSIIEESLSWPKNIDIYFYAPGSGGEFFTSLCALAHPPTRELLVSKTLEGYRKDDNIITFKNSNYFNLPNVDIGHLGIQMFNYANYIMDVNERINYYKMVLAHAILSHSDYISNNMSVKKNTFKKINIILCTHWIDILKPSENRTFGIPLFENQKYWNIINLDPQTENGQQLVLNFATKSKLRQKPKAIAHYFNNKGFNNIKLKFPFMDYMIMADFNSIKNYIENRYGSDLDFDFIDQALINYKKIRIDPYL